MAHWLNLPALAGSLLTAVALGIHLGESAIAMIDPIHFQGPALHPRDRGAAVDPVGLSSSRPPAYADLYGWEKGREALLADCGDCDALAARDRHAYSAAVPYFGGPSEPLPPPPAVPERAREGEASPAPADAPADEWEAREARIARYAHYPVDGAEEEARADGPRWAGHRRVKVPSYAADDVYLADGYPADAPDARPARHSE